MKIRTKIVEYDPKKPIYVASDAHLGGKDSADNAVASKAGLEWMMTGARKKWFWTICGDWFEAWQYDIEDIYKAWPEETSWAMEQMIINGNHDDTDDGLSIGIDLLIIIWGDLKVGIIHDPTLEYRGLKKKACKWAVRWIWKPIEMAIGWKKGKELSSGLDKDYTPFRDKAYKFAKGNRLDIIVYGHTHEKPFVKQMGSVKVINSGCFQDGRNEYVKLAQTVAKTRGEIWRTDRKKAKKLATG